MLLDIFRDVDQHGARSISGRQCKGLPHHRWDTGDTGNEEALLGNRGRNRHDIHFLKGILAEQVGGYVAGNRYDWYGIAVGIGDAGHEIGGSRTRGR
jgi:hypothetical protein